MGKAKPLYETKLGSAFIADSAEFLCTLPSKSVNLAFTSPPFALHFKKEYGNANQRDYIKWFFRLSPVRYIDSSAMMVVLCSILEERGRRASQPDHFTILNF